MAKDVHVIDHPVVQHKLTLMRLEQTSTHSFRLLLHEVSMLLAYEVTRDMPVKMERIRTPMAEMDAPVLEGKKIVIVSVLRAGDGIREGMMQILPSARVGHIGLYRDPKTLIPVEYYFRVPQEMADRDAIIVDPMLATGHTAIAAVERIKETGPRSVKFVCLLASRPGLELFHDQHPDVPVYTPAVDPTLDDDGYIIPGLGDAGDRLFGTK